MTTQPLTDKLRDFCDGIITQAQLQTAGFGLAAASYELAQADVARKLIALLDSLPALALPVEADLTGTLQRYVADWVGRSAPRIRDEMALAKLEIVLSQPQSDGDGTLYLDYSIDETVTADRDGARVTGHRFDPEPRS